MRHRPATKPLSSNMLMLTVNACGDKKVSTALAADDKDCSCPMDRGPGGVVATGSSGGGPSCAGSPIRLSNGNMRMTDRDPLPGTDSFSMTRTYDHTGAAGLFGNGWTTFLDANLLSIVEGTQTFFTIRTPANTEYLFVTEGAALIQLWPKGSTAATLTYDGTAGTYTFREPRSTSELVYRASDGVLLRLHSRTSGRDVTVTYSGGLPTHVDDSWGNWGWTLSVDATARLVNSIAVDGTSLIWNYTYDTGNLTGVAGSENATWRTYTYVSGHMTEARDARGGLIESHAYDGYNRATSSVSAQDDITSIDYLLNGRDGSERVTRTTSATGATTDYYLRYIAGRPRTVQVVGNCPLCGTNDAVYAYDATEGVLLRDQDARGYITTRTYDSSDRVSEITGPYQPSGCDPATDTAHCRLTPTDLATASLTPTSATDTTSYFYNDTNWPDIATQVSAQSVFSPGQMRDRTIQLDAVSGTVTQENIFGFTGQPLHQVISTTTIALYDGTEGAAFNPGGAFDASWMSLAQPVGLRKTVDGPRTDAADVTTSVYYPINAAVPGPLRGRLAGLRNAAGQMTRFEGYDVFGNASRIIDANGVATELTFDGMGRVLTSTIKGIAGSTRRPIRSAPRMSSAPGRTIQRLARWRRWLCRAVARQPTNTMTADGRRRQRDRCRRQYRTALSTTMTWQPAASRLNGISAVIPVPGRWPAPMHFTMTPSRGSSRSITPTRRRSSTRTTARTTCSQFRMSATRRRIRCTATILSTGWHR